MREELNKILAKNSLDGTDIDILVKNKGLLTQEELVRIGLATVPVVEKTLEPVAKQVAEPVKKAGRPRSKK